MSEWKPVRCPKCRGRSVVLEEIWRSSLTLIQREDGSLEQLDFNIEPGDPTGEIQARCDGCGHGWKLRGWRQFPSEGVEVERP